MPTMRLRKAARMILIGAPGAGKGTQSSRMLERYEQLSTISSGDLLRENVRNRTPLGALPFLSRTPRSRPLTCHATQASKPNTS